MKAFFRSTGALVASALGLFAGATVVQALAGPTLDEGVRNNFAHFVQHRDSINVVFVGSSRIGSNISPASFDARMSELGQATNSFNFWLGAMSAEESRRIVHEILRDEPRPSLLVVELLPAHGGIRDYAMFSDRNLWWRSLGNLHTVAGDLIANGSTAGVINHGKLTFVRLFRVGKGGYIVDRVRWGEPAARPVKHTGHKALRDRWGSFDDGEFMIGRVAATLRRAPASEELLKPYLRFKSQIMDIVGNSAEIMFILPPGSPLPPSNLRQDPSVLVTNDPDRYPSLYEPAKWADINHLKEEAAQEHARLLAESVQSRFNGYRSLATR